MWALLAACQALRITMTDAIAAVPGADPDRASYQIAVGTAQAMVTQARGVVTGTADLAGAIGRAILAEPEPAAPPPRLRPGQIPAQPLEQAPARQTPVPACGSRRSPPPSAPDTSRPRHAARNT
jgi:hypothetical protein